MLRTKNSWLAKSRQVSGRETYQTQMSGKRISRGASLKGVSATMRGSEVINNLRGPLSRATGARLRRGAARVRNAATGEAHTLKAISKRKEAWERAGRLSSAGTAWVKERRRMELANHNKQTFVQRTTRPIYSIWKLWKISGRCPRTSRRQIKISIS